MGQKLFQSACAALWGPQYVSPGARELGISLRAMQRYNGGERDVPVILMQRLAKLLEKRQAEIARMLPKVAQAGEEVVL